MTDALTITNVIYDEAGLPDVDTDLVAAADNNVASPSTALASQISALSLSGFYTGANAVTQYAELANFVSSTDNPVTNYSLASNSSGAGFSTSGAGVSTGLYVGADEVFLYGTSDPNVVVGRIGSGTTGSSSGAIAMLIALNESKDGSGDVTGTDLGIAMYAPLTNSDGTHVDDLDTLSPGNGSIYLYSTYNTTSIVDFPNFIGVPSGDDQYALVKPGNNTSGADLLVTGFAGSTEGSVNVSTTGLGANAQTVANGSSLRLDIVNFTQSDYEFQLGSPPGAHDISTLHYENHVEAIAAGFGLTQANPTNKLVSLTISAYQVSVDSKGSSFATNAFGDGTLIAINPNMVVIHDGNGIDVTSSFAGSITQTGDGKSIQIVNLPALYHVDFTASSQFDRFVVFNNMTSASDKTTFDVGQVHVSTIAGGIGHDYADLSPHLIFEDGGPSLTLAAGAIPTVTVDEDTLGAAGKKSNDFSGVFNVNYGPDGSGSLSYDLGVSSSGANSGLLDTASSHGIFLYMDGSDVVGRVGTSATTASSSGAVDFRISVDSSGNITFEQDYAVRHSGATVSDEAATLSSASLITLTATAHDADGDSASSPAANIGTAFSILDDEPTPLAPNPANNLTVGNTTSSGQPFSYTATDSFTTFNPGNDLLGSFTIAGPADTAGNYTWAYNDTSHTSITESYNGGALFSLALDSAGGYTMTMLGTLPDTQLNLDANKIHAGGPTSHTLDVGVVGTSTDDVLITSSPGPINASNGNVGVSNGNLDSGESLNFQLWTDMSHTSLIPFLGINVGTKSAGAATYHVTGVEHSSQAVVNLGDYGVPKNGTIHVVNSDLLDSITVSDVNGNAIKVGIAGISLLLPPSDAGFGYTAQLTDGDGDHVSAPINLFIDGNNDGAVDYVHTLFAV